jgi:hypothetical protein
MTTTAVSTTKTINVADIGPVELTVEEQGEGRSFLVLHGGAGPQSVAAFAQLLAEKVTTECSRLPIPASAAHRVPTG